MWFYDDLNEIQGFNNLREAVKRLEISHQKAKRYREKGTSASR
jgi:hypothetical protein